MMFTVSVEVEVVQVMTDCSEPAEGDGAVSAFTIGKLPCCPSLYKVNCLD